MERAKQMEEEGHTIIKLNIAIWPCSLRGAEEIRQDMIHNLPNAAAYSIAGHFRRAQGGHAIHARSRASKGVTIDDVYLGNGASELIVMAPTACSMTATKCCCQRPTIPVDRCGQSVGRHAGALYVRRGQWLDAGPGRHPRQDHARTRASW